MSGYIDDALPRHRALERDIGVRTASLRGLERRLLDQRRTHASLVGRDMAMSWPIECVIMAADSVRPRAARATWRRRRMKIPRRSLFVAFGLGLVVWVLSALVELVLFRERSFAEALLFSGATKALVSRALVVPLAMSSYIAGIMLARRGDRVVSTPGENEHLLRAVARHSSDGILLTDREGRVVACNSAQEAITGVARSDVLSRPLAEVQFESLPDELKDASRRDRMHSAVRQLLEMGSWPEIEENPLEVVEIQRADRERREFDAQAFGAPSGDGHRIGIICRNVAGGRAVGRCQGLRKEPQ